MSHRKSDLGIPCPRKICQSSASHAIPLSTARTITTPIPVSGKCAHLKSVFLRLQLYCRQPEPCRSLLKEIAPRGVDLICWRCGRRCKRSDRIGRACTRRHCSELHDGAEIERAVTAFAQDQMAV